MVRSGTDGIKNHLLNTINIELISSSKVKHSKSPIDLSTVFQSPMFLKTAYLFCNLACLAGRCSYSCFFFRGRSYKILAWCQAIHQACLYYVPTCMKHKSVEWREAHRFVSVPWKCYLAHALHDKQLKSRQTGAVHDRTNLPVHQSILEVIDSRPSLERNLRWASRSITNPHTLHVGDNHFRHCACGSALAVYQVHVRESDIRTPWRNRIYRHIEDQCSSEFRAASIRWNSDQPIRAVLVQSTRACICSRSCLRLQGRVLQLHTVLWQRAHMHWYWREGAMLRCYEARGCLWCPVHDLRIGNGLSCSGVRYGTEEVCGPACQR